MALTLDTTSWNGGSGKPYRYYIHDLNFSPPANQDGNYIFAKKSGNYWMAVYVGEGNLLERKNAAMTDGCVVKKGATHYHEHINQSSEGRFDEETDILKANKEAYDPTGCNIKTGG